MTIEITKTSTLDDLIAKYEKDGWIDCDEGDAFNGDEFDLNMKFLKENKQLKEKLEKIHKFIQTRTTKLDEARKEELKDAPPGVCVTCRADILQAEVNRFKKILEDKS